MFHKVETLTEQGGGWASAEPRYIKNKKVQPFFLCHGAGSQEETETELPNFFKCLECS